MQSWLTGILLNAKILHRLFWKCTGHLIHSSLSILVPKAWHPSANIASFLNKRTRPPLPLQQVTSIIKTPPSLTIAANCPHFAKHLPISSLNSPLLQPLSIRSCNISPYLVLSPNTSTKLNQIGKFNWRPKMVKTDNHSLK